MNHMRMTVVEMGRVERELQMRRSQQAEAMHRAARAKPAPARRPRFSFTGGLLYGRAG